MNSAAEEFYEDEGYLRRFALPFLDSRLHFGVRDLGSQLHLEGFAELHDGKQEEFDVIYTVNTETGDFAPTQDFIDHVSRLGEGAFGKVHGGSAVLLGGTFRVLGGLFNAFLKILLWFTTIGALFRGTTGLVLMLLPWAFAVVLIAQFGEAVAIGITGLVALWVILGLMRLASGKSARSRVEAAIEDLTVDIGLKIVDLVRLPDSNSAETIAGRLGGRADGGRDCIPIDRAEHAADLVIGAELNHADGSRGTLAAVELLSAIMPSSPGKTMKEKIAAEITRCLETYPAQLAPPSLPQGGAKIRALIFLVKPDGSFFELGAHLVRHGLALPRSSAEIAQANAATRGMQGPLAEETLEDVVDAQAEALRSGRGIWASYSSEPRREAADEGTFMPQEDFDRIMADLDEKDDYDATSAA